MSGLALSNSPIKSSNYRFNRRLAFLYGALRTRSQFARTELARLAETSPRAKLDLAWLVSNQAVSESDLKLAFETYQAVLAAYGWQKFSHMHLVDFAILAMKQGEQNLAAEAARRTRNLFRLAKGFIPKRLPTVPMQGVQEAMHATLFFGKDYSVASEFLKVDIENPFRGQSRATEICASTEAADWLKRLNHELFDATLEPLEFAKATATWQNPFDLLQARVKPASVQGPKVTVVISTFKPDESLLTAVHSTLNQSWANLEVLVVDDCSPAEYQSILGEVAQLDSRVKVLRQKVNGGTYLIRNRALDEATGEFITFQDSDDYMHPRRVELQALDLIRHGKKVANISLSTRLTDRLEAIETNRRLRIGLCEPSLMFRREVVRNRIGYFDSVRKSADSEYRKRIMKAFGQDCTAVHPFRILTVQRADNGGLTQGELGFRWITEFRLVYRDCYLHFHRTSQNLRIEKVARKFYAPRQSLMSRAEAQQARSFDLVIMANLRSSDQVAKVVERVSEALAQNLSVGLFQVNSLYPLNRNLGTIKAPIIELLNAQSVSMVFAGDEVSCANLELMAPNTFAVSFSGERFNWKVGKVSVVGAPEAFLAQPLEPLLNQALQKANLA